MISGVQRQGVAPIGTKWAGIARQGMFVSSSATETGANDSISSCLDGLYCPMFAIISSWCDAKVCNKVLGT
jgi:hypothetical protein